MKKEKLVLIFLFLFLCVGFRTSFQDYRWEVSQSDPYLWIKLCDRNITLPIDVDSNDELYGEYSINTVTALNSLLKDINGIFASYIRLEIYPADPSNPPAQSNFNITKAQRRTITLCAGNPSDLAGGQSQKKFDGKKIINCEIVYDPDIHHSLKSYLGMIGHELGHCLGLDHPQDIADSLMSYYSDPEKIYRLAPDDKIGIRYLYPANVPGVSHKEEPTYGLSCAYKK